MFFISLPQFGTHCYGCLNKVPIGLGNGRKCFPTGKVHIRSLLPFASRNQAASYRGQEGQTAAAPSTGVNQRENYPFQLATRERGVCRGAAGGKAVTCPQLCCLSSMEGKPREMGGSREATNCLFHCNLEGGFHSSHTGKCQAWKPLGHQPKLERQMRASCAPGGMGEGHRGMWSGEAEVGRTRE